MVTAFLLRVFGHIDTVAVILLHDFRTTIDAVKGLADPVAPTEHEPAAEQHDP
jgi:hypothetical protein